MPLKDNYEESTLLSLLAQDSEYAFQLVFDRYRNRIYHVGMMYLKSPILAEEIVQDVFLKLWFQRQNIAHIRSLESWLFTLAKNLTLNALKKIAHEWNAREKWLDAHHTDSETADHKLLASEYSRLVTSAIESLSQQQQQVYCLAKEQDMSYEKIGQQLGISALTVKTHMSRALAAIRSCLLKQGIVPPILLLATFFQ